MDPSATLKEIRELSLAVMLAEGKLPALAARLADAIGEMDQWMSTGGFTPVEWMAHR